jgi:hypothetical protein
MNHAQIVVFASSAIDRKIKNDQIAAITTIHFYAP